MKDRLIGAVILLGILVPLIILGGLPFQIGVGVISIFAFKELFTLYSKNNKVPVLIEVFSYISVVMITLSLDAFIPAVALSIMLFFIPLIFYNKEEYNYNTGIGLFGIVLFVSLIFYNIIGIRLASFEEFIYLPVITIASDTIAYIGGSLFGRNKLIERVSPNKTIEGSIMALIVSTSVASAYYLYFIDPGSNVFVVVIASFLLSVISQLGDLVFSVIKRQNDVKDYSNLIPGHGGVLDRFDSLAFVALFYAVIRMILL